MIQRRSPQFRWLERGDGEPVVLLHGLMGHMDHWDATLDAVAPSARLFAPELPFFDPAIEHVSLAVLARHVRDLLDALGIGRAVVGGNSLGGHIALELALAHPDRVSGLVLTGSSGLFERSVTQSVPHRPSAAYVREKMGEVFFDAALVTDGWVASVHRTVTTRFSALRVVQLARAARATSVEPFLGRIQAPTLLVWGKDDRITPPSVAQRFNALIPRSELVFLPSCGHAAMLEQPGAFNSVLRHWLESSRALREILTVTEAAR
jgi:pimeloyl-ACP methyl ester carboxylesterase